MHDFKKMIAFIKENTIESIENAYTASELQELYEFLYNGKMPAKLKTKKMIAEHIKIHLNSVRRWRALYERIQKTYVKR